MLKYCGYDRACDLHPFIEGMSKKGGVVAKIIDEHAKFLVDKFLCIKHREPCMPLDNPKCVYHPDLQSFKVIHVTNTMCRANIQLA